MKAIRKYLDAVLVLTWLGRRKRTCPRQAFLCTKNKLMTGELLEAIRDHSVSDSASEVYFTARKTRADAQLRGVDSGIDAREADPRLDGCSEARVTRYLKGTRDFVNKLELDNEVDKHVVKTGWVFRQ